MGGVVGVFFDVGQVVQVIFIFGVFEFFIIIGVVIIVVFG